MRITPCTSRYDEVKDYSPVYDLPALRDFYEDPLFFRKKLAITLWGSSGAWLTESPKNASTAFAFIKLSSPGLAFQSLTEKARLKGRPRISKDTDMAVSLSRGSS